MTLTQDSDTMTAIDPYEIAARYGVQFEGTLVGADYHEQVDYADEYSLADIKAAGGTITRVRILAERWSGAWMCDISYIHATLANGKTVPVQVELESGALYGPRGVKARMIEWAKAEGVFAKALGMLDESVWSVMKG